MAVIVPPEVQKLRRLVESADLSSVVSYTNVLAGDAVAAVSAAIPGVGSCAHIAAGLPDVGILRHFLELGIPADLRFSSHVISDVSLLHTAVSEGNVAAMRLLIQSGCNIEAVNSMGQSPLHVACRLANSEVAIELLSAGAFVSAQDARGLTPLHVAVLRGQLDLCRKLLFMSGTAATVNTADEDGNTPLHIAAEWGARDLVAAMLSAGADANSLNKSHQTPLHKADDDTILDVLVAAGGDLSIRDRSAKTARPARIDHDTTEIRAIQRTLEKHSAKLAAPECSDSQQLKRKVQMNPAALDQLSGLRKDLFAEVRAAGRKELQDDSS